MTNNPIDILTSFLRFNNNTTPKLIVYFIYIQAKGALNHCDCLVILYFQSMK